MKSSRSGRTALVQSPAAAGAFSAALLGAVLWPIRENWRVAKKDSFPLSYYPMFSLKRRGRLRVSHLLGIDTDGVRHHLPYTCLGGGGLNQVRKQISRQIKAGAGKQLCCTAAREVVRRWDPARPRLVSVSVVTCEYRLDGWFAGNREPVREWCHYTEPVALP